MNDSQGETKAEVSCEEDTTKFQVLLNRGPDTVRYILCDYQMVLK